MKVGRLNVLAACAVGAIVLAGCQTTREVGEPTGSLIYAKADMTGDSAVSDFNTCGAIARNVKHKSMPVSSGGGGLIGLLAGVAVASVLNGMEQAKARHEAWERCMSARQYVKVQVPEEVGDAYKDAEDEAGKAAVLDSWIASPAYANIADWFQAEKTRTAEAYRAYLAKYPRGDFRYKALIRAAERDGVTIPLSQIRNDAYLVARLPDLFGVSKQGWTTIQADGKGPVDCRNAVSAEAVFRIDAGAVSGELYSAQLSRPVKLTGTLDEDGTFYLSSTWPHESPFRFNGSYNDAGLVEGYLTGASSEGCNQPVWMEASFTAPERTAPETGSTAPGHAADTPIALSGIIVGDGTKSDYGRAFCSTSDPHDLSLDIANGVVTGTMIRSPDGKRIAIAGTFDGVRVTAEFISPESFTKFVMTGDLEGSRLKGHSFSPTIGSCNATFDLRTEPSATG